MLHVRYLGIYYTRTSHCHRITMETAKVHLGYQKYPIEGHCWQTFTWLRSLACSALLNTMLQSPPTLEEKCWLIVPGTLVMEHLPSEFRVPKTKMTTELLGRTGGTNRFFYTAECVMEKRCSLGLLSVSWESIRRGAGVPVSRWYEGGLRRSTKPRIGPVMPGLHAGEVNGGKLGCLRDRGVLFKYI